MALYTDDYCIVETNLIVSLAKGNGHGEHDGIYAIQCLLIARGKWREAVYLYDNEDERNIAFTAIAELMRTEESECVADDDDHDDTLGLTIE